MDKQDPPRSFGVFKPTGHTVAAFPAVQQADAAVEQLLASGFDTARLTRYTPSEMVAQTETDISRASAVAAVGQELNLVKLHRELAIKGWHFVVAHAPEARQTARFADVARACGALTAQHYGRLIITELIDNMGGVSQVFESPDRGLDTHLPI